MQQVAYHPKSEDCTSSPSFSASLSAILQVQSDSQERFDPFVQYVRTLRNRSRIKPQCAPARAILYRFQPSKSKHSPDRYNDVRLHRCSSRNRVRIDFTFLWQEMCAVVNLYGNVDRYCPFFQSCEWANGRCTRKARKHSAKTINCTRHARFLSEPAQISLSAVLRHSCCTA